MASMLERARAIADDVLFPAALDVDADGVVPSSHFDLLAEEGFYGLAGRAGHGGVEADFPSFVGIVETFCGGCLATAFAWLQHHSVVRGLTGTPNLDLREKYLGAAIRGELRGGVAFAGAIPQPPRLWATATDGGWLVSGESPFVSGWGIVDMLLISARNTAGGSEGSIVSGLVDADAGHGITADELQLVAAQGSNTVRLCFADFFLPAEKGRRRGLPCRVPRQPAQQRTAERQPRHGDRGAVHPDDRRGRPTRRRAPARHPTVRDPDTLPAARAAASELAYRAAGALVVAVGSSGILVRRHAQRLVREATFTLVAAGRPEIKTACWTCSAVDRTDWHPTFTQMVDQCASFRAENAALVHGRLPLPLMLDDGHDDAERRAE